MCTVIWKDSKVMFLQLKAQHFKVETSYQSWYQPSLTIYWDFLDLTFSVEDDAKLEADIILKAWPFYCFNYQMQNLYVNKLY